MINIHYNKEVFQVKEDEKSTTTERIVEIASQKTGIDQNKLRVYYDCKTGRVLLLPKQTVEQAGTHDFYIRNTGPQLPFRFAQLLEYVPCIFIWIIVYLIMDPKKKKYRTMLSAMWIAHYIKRTLEVCFVHIFSNKTLPIFAIIESCSFKNCLYYWIFAACQAYFGLRKHHYCKNLVIPGLIVFIIGEIGNGYSHIKLRLLRPKGSHLHYKPHGFLFDSITCPNYTFEILSWIGFAMVSQTVVSILFPICGGSQMFIWADEKRKKLGEEFPDVLNRGRLLPCKYL